MLSVYNNKTWIQIPDVISFELIHLEITWKYTVSEIIRNKKRRLKVVTYTKDYLFSFTTIAKTKQLTWKWILVLS